MFDRPENWGEMTIMERRDWRVEAQREWRKADPATRGPCPK